MAIMKDVKHQRFEFLLNLKDYYSSLDFKPPTFLITAMCYKDTDWCQSQLPRKADWYKNQTDGFSSGNNLSMTLVYLSSQKSNILLELVRYVVQKSWPSKNKTPAVFVTNNMAACLS